MGNVRLPLGRPAYTEATVAQVLRVVTSTCPASAASALWHADSLPAGEQRSVSIDPGNMVMTAAASTFCEELSLDPRGQPGPWCCT